MVRMHVGLSAVLLLAACTDSREVPVLTQSSRPAAAEMALDGQGPGGLPPKSDDEIRAHHLNIGAGTCVIVECPGDGAPLLVDCGSTGATDDDMNRDDVVAYAAAVFGAHGVPPVVTLSHGDKDHYSYIPDLFDGTAPASAWIGGERAEYRDEMEAWFASQEAAGVEINENFPAGFSNNGDAVAGMTCGTAETFIMTVNVEGETDTNPKSIVLGIKHGELGMIFTGDAEGTTEASAAANFPGEFASSVILTGSHHGATSHGSNSEEWVAAAKADVVIFSAGDRFFHPRCVAVDRFHDGLLPANNHPIRCGSSTAFQERETDKAEYVTEMNGAIVITGKADGTFSILCSHTENCGPITVSSARPAGPTDSASAQVLGQTAALLTPPAPGLERSEPPIDTACCKVCTKGKACGNSCISREKTCHKPPGCACNAH
jgi:beta-lactamase superfamily II metal-dependent hydrolase